MGPCCVVVELMKRIQIEIACFQIKSAFYMLLAAMCNTNSSVAEQFADKICPQVLHNLGESDPLVCPALWEAALYVVSVIPVRGFICFNLLALRPNVRLIAGFIFNCIFFNKDLRIWFRISLKFVPMIPVDYKSVPGRRQAII